MNFTFLKIPVQIRPTFWILLLFFTNIYREFSITSLLLGGIFTISLLVHEYGHAIAALHFGSKAAITLEGFGGYTQYSPIGISPKQRFFITLSGPLLESLLIVIPFFLLKSDFFLESSLIQYLLQATMRLNILWCLLNLLPIEPLDGGHLLRYLLEKKFGSKGSRFTLYIGLLSALIAVPVLYLLGFFFFGCLLLILGFQTFQALKQIKPSTNENNPLNNYMRGIEAINNHETEKAKLILKKLLKSKNRKIKYSAAESLAKIYFQENEPQKTYDLLMKTDPAFLKEGKCILCKLAFEKKNYELVGKFSRDIYALEPTFEIALLNSKAFAHLNDPALSGGWLETASLFGPEFREKIKEIIEQKSFDSVRNQELFTAYAKKIEDGCSSSVK